MKDVFARFATAVTAAGLQLGIGLLLLFPILHESATTSFDVLLTGAALLVTGIGSRWNPSRRTAIRVLAGTLLAFVSVQLLVVTNHTCEMANDFSIQWRTAVTFATKGASLPNLLQEQRALPFYYPLASIFGGSDAVFQTANVVMTTLTWLMTVWIARRLFGWSGAAKTGILLTFAFEPYVANNIATHDLLGAWGILLFLLLLTEFDHAKSKGTISLAKTLVLAISAALVVSWTHWQRGTGLYGIGILALYGLGGVIPVSPHRRSRIVFASLSLFFVFVTLGAIDRAGWNAPRTNTKTLLSFSGYDGGGRFRDKILASRAINALRPEDAERLSKVLFLETLRTGPVDKYENYLGAATHLLRFGKESNWYLTTEDSGRHLSVRSLRTVYDGVRSVMTPTLWALLILASVLVLKNPRNALEGRWMPYWVVALHLFLLGALAENQPRYSYFVVFLAAIYVGCPWMAELFSKKADIPDSPRSDLRIATPRWLLASLTVVLLVFVGHRTASALHDVSLVNFHRLTISTDPSMPRDLDAVERFGVVVRQNSLRVRHPSDTSPEQPLVFSGEVLAKSDHHSQLRFLVETGPRRNRFGKRMDLKGEPFQNSPGRSMQLVLDGQVRKTIDLSGEFSNDRIVVNDVTPGSHEFELRFQFGTMTSDPDSVETVISFLGIY